MCDCRDDDKKQLVGRDIDQAARLVSPGGSAIIVGPERIADAAAIMKPVGILTSFGTARFEPPPDGPGATEVYRIFIESMRELCNHCERVAAIKEERDPERRATMYRGWKRMFDREYFPDLEWKMRRAYVTPESYNHTLKVVLELIRSTRRSVELNGT